jgi:hypothetical protein
MKRRGRSFVAVLPAAVLLSCAGGHTPAVDDHGGGRDNHVKEPECGRGERYRDKDGRCFVHIPQKNPPSTCRPVSCEAPIEPKPDEPAMCLVESEPPGVKVRVKCGDKPAP